MILCVCYKLDDTSYKHTQLCNTSWTHQLQAKTTLFFTKLVSPYEDHAEIKLDYSIINQVLNMTKIANPLAFTVE